MPEVPYEMRVTPGHPIPVGRQVSAAIECAIRDGLFAPGGELPATRELARRVGVHRNTVRSAYARLRRRGLVTGGNGGPFRSVLPPLAVLAPLALESGDRRSPARDAPDPESPGRGSFGARISGVSDGADALARTLAAEILDHGFRRALEAGAPRGLLVRALRRSLAFGSPDVRLLEPRAGLRIALQAELRARAGILAPVVSAHDLVREDRRGAPSPWRVVLAREEVAARVAPRVASELIPFRLAGGARELGLVRALGRPGVVAVFTVSRVVRDYAREIAACEHAAGVSIATPSVWDRTARRRAARVARLVLADAFSLELVPETRAAVRTLHLLPAPVAERLRSYLGPPEEDATCESSSFARG